MYMCMEQFIYLNNGSLKMRIKNAHGPSIRVKPGMYKHMEW
jgi:hypothetical protein